MKELLDKVAEYLNVDGVIYYHFPANPTVEVFGVVVEGQKDVTFTVSASDLINKPMDHQVKAIADAYNLWLELHNTPHDPKMGL